MGRKSRASAQEKSVKRRGAFPREPIKARSSAWSYTIRDLGYARFCSSCRIRATSRPYGECLHPEHLDWFRQSSEFKRHPKGIKPKSRNGAGWTVREGKYGRSVCSSCKKEPNCLPTEDCTNDEHAACYQKWRKNLKFKHWESKARVVELLGGKCVGCGITDLRLLQVNQKTRGSHVKWDRRSTTKFFNWIQRGKLPLDAYDLRCANCNIIYEYELGHIGVPEAILRRTRNLEQ